MTPLPLHLLSGKDRQFVPLTPYTRALIYLYNDGTNVCKERVFFKKKFVKCCLESFLHGLLFCELLTKRCYKSCPLLTPLYIIPSVSKQ